MTGGQIDAVPDAFAEKDAEIKRLRMLNDELHKLLDGVERRECEYLALIEKHATENEARRVQWEAAKREAEKWVHESGVRLGEAHKEIARLTEQCKGLAQSALNNGEALLHAETEVKRLTLLHDISERQAHLEIKRLKAERHTTKQMLEDILYKHSQHYGLGRGGLGPKVVKDDPA